MPGNIGSSRNYIWSTSSCLGTGSTGSVYKGFVKESGEAVAVKTFKHGIQFGQNLVQNREFEVLRKVDHENIVKLLAVEKETGNLSPIIVMELCAGGSLFTIISNPKNAFGLQEEEFLLVLKHTSDGMKHLRDLNIVHRDLKPGNIIKFITNDGRPIYKLTDFGAARELEEGQQFDSLCGTLDYLHPDLFERAVMKKEEYKLCGASVDLWSFGVTLYHVATGSLPFKPFGGRNNRETMYKMTTQKESGFISGFQKSANGAIEWSDQLPSFCQLSAGLRKFITPILAGLMECDPNKMWTFDHFFTEVTCLMEKRRHILFFVDQCQLLTLYVDPNDKAEQFRSLVQEQTNIINEKQRLFFENKCFEDVVDTESKVAIYPQTCFEKPLFLVGNVLQTINYTHEESCYFPTLDSFHAADQVANVARAVCSNAYYVKRCVEKIALRFYLLQDFAQTLNAVIKSQFIKAKFVVDQAVDKSKLVNEKINLLQSRHQTTSALLDLFESSNHSIIDGRTELANLVKIKQESCSTIFKQLHTVHNNTTLDYQIVVAEDLLWNHWKELPSFKKDLKKCLACANNYVRYIRNSWLHFDNIREKRDTISLLNDPFYIIEKLRFDETRRKLCRLYQDECLSVLKDSVKEIGQWLQLVHKTAINRTDEDLPKLVDILDDTLNKVDETYDEIVNEKIAKCLSKSNIRRSNSQSVSTNKRLNLFKIIKKAKAIADAKDDTVEILEKNKVIISRLKAASISLNNTIDKCKEQI